MATLSEASSCEEFDAANRRQFNSRSFVAAPPQDDNYGFGGVAGGGVAGAAGFEKSTGGGPCSAAPVAVKYLRDFAPVTLAVITAGNCRMYALYEFTAWL